MSFLAPLVFVPAILIFAKESGGISLLLKRPPFQFMGRVSYTIYIMHAFIVVLFARCLRVLASKGVIVSHTQEYLVAGHYSMKLLYFGSERLQNLVVLCMATSVVFASYFLYRFVEEPARVYFVGLGGRLNAAPVPSVTDS